MSLSGSNKRSALSYRDKPPAFNVQHSVLNQPRLDRHRQRRERRFVLASELSNLAGIGAGAFSAVAWPYVYF